MNAVDTNVFIYALDAANPVKGEQAVRLLAGLQTTDTALPWQVACEVGAVIARWMKNGVMDSTGYAAISAVHRRFPLVIPGAGVLDLGMTIHRELRVSYWDAMLIAACADVGISRLYSEDVKSAPRIAGVEIVNPFS